MVLSLDRWRGKVAIVTGASSGIGAATVEQLVENGLIVAGIARRLDRLEKLAKKLEGKKGKLHPVKADITKEDELLAAFKWVKDNLGPPHILINSAGAYARSSLVDGTTEDWKKIFDVHVLGLSVATREAIKEMKSNSIDGHIIHINAIDGHYIPNLPGLSMLPASKFAVTALTETLRQELNRLGLKIRITSVSPGFVETEMTTLGPPEIAEEIKQYNFPALQAEDIADGVIYALSTPAHVQVHELTIRPLGEPY